MNIITPEIAKALASHSMVRDEATRDVATCSACGFVLTSRDAKVSFSVVNIQPCPGAAKDAADEDATA